MRLAAPSLLAALALLVPIVVTFLVRRRRRVLRVPSTLLWRLGARSVVKSRRLRDLRRLLALLACAAGVAALVVAAARPTGKRGDAAVYVVDVSASMAGAPLSDVRGWLTRELASLGPEARVAIVLAGAEARVALPLSPPGPAADEAIRSIAAEREIAAIDDALALAEGLAHGARVVVLSDRPVDVGARRPGAEPQQRLFPRGEAHDNVGVTSLFTRTAPDARDEEEREASISVATSSEVARRARLRLTLGGRVVADRRLELPARGQVTERIGLRGAGVLVARVEPDDGRPDALAFDDEASLEEVARRAPRVTLVRRKEGGAAGYFVAKALRAAGVAELSEVDADGAPDASAEIAVVLDDGSGRPSHVPALLLGAEPEGSGLAARPAGAKETQLRSLATEDPLLRGVALDGLTILSAKVVAPPRGARTLVDLDGGAALVAGGSGKDAWVWLGIDPEASDLVLRVAFPVLVGNVLAHLAGASQVVVAKTAPRSEVMLEADHVGAPLATATEPAWRVPVSPPLLLAGLGAVLLAIEAMASSRRRWAR